MGRLWSSAIGKGEHQEIDFQRAALSLVCGQIFYASNPQQRSSYNLIRNYRSHIAEVLEHLGLDLRVDEEARMAYVVPFIDIEREISRRESLLAVVLRGIHHEHSQRGESEQGVVNISLGELFTCYKAATDEELPRRTGELDALIDAMRRFGFVRKVESPDGSDAPYDLQILPGVAALISEPVLKRLSGSTQLLAEEPTVS